MQIGKSSQRQCADRPTHKLIVLLAFREVDNGEGIFLSRFANMAGSSRVALAIHRITAAFPRHELYGLTSQMRRAAVSISSNIAEGKGHFSDGDFGRFLSHARGSLLELQTQIIIAQGLVYISKEQTTKLMQSTDDLGRGLNGLIQTVRTTSRSCVTEPRIAFRP